MSKAGARDQPDTKGQLGVMSQAGARRRRFAENTGGIDRGG
jgi:hypothetical protein